MHSGPHRHSGIPDSPVPFPLPLIAPGSHRAQQKSPSCHLDATLCA